MTNVERIAALAEAIESDTRKATINEMIADLIEFTPDDSATREGWEQAIKFLRYNFS